MSTTTYTSRDRNNISGATGFDFGEGFESETQVRDYFTLVNMRDMFGADAAEMTTDDLAAMADAVIENRWNCDF